MLSTRKYLFGTTVLAGLLTLAMPAFAQTTPVTQPPVTQDIDPDEDVVEEIIVTGSRIRRDPTTSPTPLTQVSGETLLETGQSSVIDYLATLPALMNSTIPADTTQGVLNAGGLALANLRSLGTGRTLTLVDGRRHVGSQGGSLSVDIDTIPRLLIENVEIITGGASSVYGADAVSGVLNFVLRKDFEGLEIDANYLQLNQDGQASYRVSVLGGQNFLDDRLNVYGFAEYEEQDEVTAADVDWLRDSWVLLTRDADTAALLNDGVFDTELFRDRRTLQILRWGQVTLANSFQSSPTSNPLVISAGNCTGANSQAPACFGVAPGRTWIFEGTSSRLANFGTLLSNTGTSFVSCQDCDGENPNTIFNITSFYPASQSQRYQVGSTFEIVPNVSLYAEAKYVFEETQLGTGLAFADVFISGLTATDSLQILSPRTAGPSQFQTRLDNAFLPANLRTAILNNRAEQYGAPTATSPAPLLGTNAAPFARYSAWTTTRRQFNERELQRYVVGARGSYERLGFIRNLDWDLGYTYGQVDVANNENSLDGERFAYALDSVVDTAGVLGTPGRVVCRVQLLTANGGTVTNRNVGTTPARYTANDPVVRDCRPLNIFGMGNQSDEANAYIAADITVLQTNIQHDVLGSVAGQLWDFWGAGPIGVALGAEYRKEETEGVGRDADTGTRWLFLNTGPNLPRVSYESKEVFAEIAIPLLSDSWLGEFAELSGSYRYSDFDTTGGSDVFGVNLVYRPIADIAFKTSFNTSVRSPSLTEIFAPASQTFLLFTDPCDALNIQNLADSVIQANRRANCATLAAELGLAGLTFTDPQAPNAYRPVYGSSVPGRNSGNPFLTPEESESFTFSTVIQPRFIPDFSLVLDYFEIEIDQVIAAVSAQTAGNNCVSGPALNRAACATLTRSGVDDPATARDDRFLLIDFIQGSINYAKRTVRGLDFTTNYRFDTAERLGRNWGTFNHSISGSWTIEQKQFNNIDNPADFTEFASLVDFPRVRFTSRLNWVPNETWSVSWIADFQTSQDIVQRRAIINNLDNRLPEYYSTGNFTRHDFLVRYNVNDELTLRAGITNAFDEEQARWLGGGIVNNFDPWGRRFNIGLRYRPF